MGAQLSEEDSNGRYIAFDYVQCALSALAAENAELKAGLAAKELWVWRAADGVWWLFDNEYPCYPNGDPMTLGEPWGKGIFKISTPREAFKK